MNAALDLNRAFDLATRRYNPTPSPQTAEDHARGMLERARQGLQVNQRRYEKARRRGCWDVVANSLGGIERAEQAIRCWQQQLDRIRSSQGPYRFEEEVDTLLDEATYLERGIHGYFPFTRCPPARCRHERRAVQYPKSHFEDELYAMIDPAFQPQIIPGGGRSSGYRGISNWLQYMTFAENYIFAALDFIRRLPRGTQMTDPELSQYRKTLLRGLASIRAAKAEVRRVISRERQARVIPRLNQARKLIVRAVRQNPVREIPSPDGRGLFPGFAFIKARKAIQLARRNVSLGVA